jgi:hypothetical protein
MPCLERLSSKYHFSETGTGILVAIGISIPELTTNLLSSFSFKRETLGYGFGAIVGSGAFGNLIINYQRFHCMLRLYGAFLTSLPQEAYKTEIKSVAQGYIYLHTHHPVPGLGILGLLGTPLII